MYVGQVFVIVTAPGELGTTGLADTVNLWVAVLRPQVIHQVGLNHKLAITVWLCARAGLLPPVDVGQVSLELPLASKLHVALWALAWFDSLVH